MTTMKEIAEQTGVSISTVSLVLNGRDEGRVNPALAALVRNKATELGYKINPLARSLRTNKTRILGFISEEVATTPYAGGIILGAQDAASAYGYMLFTVSTDGKASEENEIATLKRYGVDGFFYSKMSNRIAHVPESLNEYPVVMVDATDHENKVPSIEPDEFMIGYDATNRLIQAGCKRIAYVGCAENMIAQDGRLAGYRTALQEAGRAFNPSLVCNVVHNGPALRAVNKVFDDEQCAARRGLTVGKDISVVGVDNHRVFAETLEPQLTTVELPHYEMGYWSACKLISMIEGKDVDTSSCPSARASLPPLDAPIPAKIHCALLEKDSVIS